MDRLEHSVIAVSAETDWTEWDQFVHRAPSGTVYHTGAWLAALAIGMGQAIRLHRITEYGVIRA